MLEYKAVPHGCRVVRIPRFYPSSQKCCKCGYQNKDTNNLAIRAWDCPVCGHHHDRDVNAARNILDKAKETISVQASKHKNTVGITEINAHGECESPFAKAEGCSRRSGNLPPQTPRR